MNGHAAFVFAAVLVLASGCQNNTFRQVGNITELMEWLNETRTNSTAMKTNICLTGDIVFDENTTQHMPIGNSNTPYSGVFDGNGHTIRGLVVNNSGCAGLFYRLGSSTVKKPCD